MSTERLRAGRTYTEDEIKQTLREALGIAIYGVKAVYDYEDYEIMALLLEIMQKVESPKDFFNPSTEIDKLSIMYIKERTKIAREAITVLRKDTRHWPDSPGFDLSTYPLSYGFYGLLDYIELGNPKKIMDPTLRRFVQTIIMKNTEGTSL